MNRRKKDSFLSIKSFYEEVSCKLYLIHMQAFIKREKKYEV